MSTDRERKLDEIARRFRDTPWVSPAEMYEMGFTMILYPATVLFRAVAAIRYALQDLKAGHPLQEDASVNMDQFEEIVGLDRWQKIEQEFGGPGVSGE